MPISSPLDFPSAFFSAFPLWLDQLIPVMRDAGEAVLQVYASDFQVVVKEDESPVTAADERAERLITQALERLAPAIPVVAEEASCGRRPGWPLRLCSAGRSAGWNA
ncbi:MAG: hypothetical protein R3E42_01775 [Burkholderiaceae bacterium]